MDDRDLYPALNKGAKDKPDQRASAAKVVARLLSVGELSEENKKDAFEILDHLSRDTEVKVRAAFAQAITGYPRLPASIAERLAADVNAVALPVLGNATCLSDTFLEEILTTLKDGDPRYYAIASREHISEQLSARIVQGQNPSVIATLLKNDGAQINEDTMNDVLDTCKDEEEILNLVADRKELRETTLYKYHVMILDDMLSEHIATAIQQKLIRNHGIPESIAEDIVINARERMLSHDMALREKQDTKTLNRFTARLHKKDMLTASLLLRNLCAGDMNFFVAALSELTGEPLKTVQAAIYGAGEEAFRELYLKSQLSLYYRFAITRASQILASKLPLNSDKTVTSAEVMPEIMKTIVGFYRSVAPGTFEQIICQIQNAADYASRRKA